MTLAACGIRKPVALGYAEAVMSIVAPRTV